MFSALAHVSLGVRDLAKATHSSAVLLGRRPSRHGEQPGAGTASALFRLENVALELRAPLGDGAGARALHAHLETAGEGLLGLAFRTPDADSCRSALAERGLAPGPVSQGLDRDPDSGAFRRWRGVELPPERTRGVSLVAVEPLSPESDPSPSPPLGDERAAVSALDHAVVRTPDPDAAALLYGEQLGLRLAADRRFPEWGVRLLFFRLGDVTIELAAPLEAEANPPATDALWGLSWRVPSAEAARARLAAQGIDVSEVRPGRKPGTRVVSVRDGTQGVPTLLIEARS